MCTKTDLLFKRYNIFKKRTRYLIYLSFELEFYAHLLNGNSLPNPCLEKLHKTINEISSFSICKEDGYNQYEVILNKPEELPNVVKVLVTLKNRLVQFSREEKIVILFSSRIANNYLPNSLHLSISLHDKNKHPIFTDINFRPPRNHLIFNCINGLCKLLPESFLFFLNKKHSLVRFNYMNNSNILPRGFVPSNISWGINNRTVSIRICRSNVFQNSYRIEHRVPCADCNPILAISAILIAIEYGLNELSSLPYLNQCFGISQTQIIEQLECFPKAIDKIKYNFKHGEVLVFSDLFFNYPY